MMMYNYSPRAGTFMCTDYVEDIREVTWKRMDMAFLAQNSPGSMGWKDIIYLAYRLPMHIVPPTPGNGVKDSYHQG